MDRISKESRSWLMSRISSTDTKPELRVRSMLHRLGFRFRTHKEGLIGKPDIVMAGKKTVIFIHGCFWHRHNCKKGRSVPKSNKQFWLKKLDANKQRDARINLQLKKENWKVITIWECQTKEKEKLEKILKENLYKL